MPLIFLTKERRTALSAEAELSRRGMVNRLAAAVLVVLYNVVAAVDICSTQIGVATGVAEEVNPLLRAGMEHLGLGWIVAKLALQAVITAMVLWFPHRIVLAIFACAIAVNAAVVLNNLHIVFVR